MIHSYALEASEENQCKKIAQSRMYMIVTHKTEGWTCVYVWVLLSRGPRFKPQLASAALQRSLSLV